MIRAARVDELDELRAFDGCGADVRTLVADKQDALARWTFLGTMTHDGVRRAYVMTAGAGAVAYIEGDGRRFGTAGAPSTAELTLVSDHFRIA